MHVAGCTKCMILTKGKAWWELCRMTRRFTKVEQLLTLWSRLAARYPLKGFLVVSFLVTLPTNSQ